MNLGFDVVPSAADLIDERWITICHELGLRMHAANVDKADELRRVAELGVDQLSTNDCTMAVSALRGASTA